MELNNWMYTPYGYLHNPWQLVRDTYYNFKYMCQRIYRGWDDRAVWSVDAWFCDIMPELLKKLQKNKHGIPAEMFEDQMNITDEDQEIAEEKWNKILHEMIEGIEAGQSLINDVSPAWDEVHDEFNRRYPGMDWLLDDTYKSKLEEIEKEFNYDAKEKAWHDDKTAKFNKGMKLFHKHFFSLWD